MIKVTYGFTVVYSSALQRWVGFRMNLLMWDLNPYAARTYIQSTHPILSHKF